MISRTVPQTRGVTLTELLVVLAIISLLATIAVPVYIQKTEQARVAVARQEVREIADTELQVMALYGYFVPIHFLNNLADLPAGQTTTQPRDDFENDPNLSQHAAIDPLANFQNQITSPIYFDPSHLTSLTADVRLQALVRNWAGPFLNPQRLQYGFGDMGSLTIGAGGVSQATVSGALVIDPWGRPYRMYSPLGVVGTADVLVVPTPNQSTNLYDLTYDNGRLTRTDPRFDRWAIVSFGHDGVTDTGKAISGAPAINQEIRDDVFYVFGIVPGESFYKAF